MFQFAPPDIDFGPLLPVAVVAITGVIALIAEMLAPKRDNGLLTALSLCGLLLAGGWLLLQIKDAPYETAAGMISHDSTSSVLQLIIVGCTAVTILFSDRYLIQKRIPFGEFYPLVLWSSCGAMLMTTSNNLMMIFIGLEILSIALYVMAGMSREERKSEESAMKYFLLGAFASGFFLYGIALFYGATGSLDLHTTTQIWLLNVGESHLLLACSFGLMLIGLSFKAGFVPFHQWTPDAYQGAPTNVTAFMATVSKIGAFGALFRVLTEGSALSNLWITPMSIVAILTMVFGNVLALAQTDVKRALAYSSISHAGYILVDLIAQSKRSGLLQPATLAYYLLSYSLMTLGSFAILTMFTTNGVEGTSYRDVKGLWKRSPLAAALLVLFMLSLIGIPPLSGFFGKAFIFADALKANLGVLAFTLAVSSVISVVYYLRIALAAVSDSDEVTEIDQRTAPFSGTVAGTAILCAVGVLACAIFYAPLMDSFQLGADQGQEVFTQRSKPTVGTTRLAALRRINSHSKQRI
jgi:NADH-quinone oxidoreductase subunit N